MKLKWLIIALILCSSVSAWDPIIGIPTPTFGIDQVNTMYAGQTYGAGGFAYRDAGNGPYTHYVDNSVACNDANAGGYGTQAQPRCTIPETALAAGSVVEVHGGPYYPGSTVTKKYILTGSGSSSQPVFYRGIGSPRIQDRQGTIAGQYTVFEGFLLDNSGSTSSLIILGGHHLSIRNNELRNQLYVNQGGGCALCVASTSDNVIYDNHIHHNVWAPGATEEHDVHGIQVPHTSSRIWIIDNEIDHSGGDAVQVNSGCLPNPARCPNGPMARYIYIGRNLFHHDTENAIDIKSAEDVIISQNEAYGYVPVQFVSSGSDGTAIVINDDNIFNVLNNRIWVIFNEIHSSNIGVRTQAYAYVIGNVIHDTADSAMVEFGTHDIWFEHNTLYNVPTGVWRGDGGSGSELFMKNNLIQQRTTGIDLLFTSGTVGNPSIVSGNMFQSPARITFAGTTYNSLAAFVSAHNKCTDCIEGNALLIDPASDNFNLQQGSPAIDKVTGSDVYAQFLSLYGLSIAYDINGVPRPQGGSWDIGAHEFVSSGGYIWPPSISGATPTGLIPTTTNVSIRLSTSEAATCKYSTQPGVAYASMQSTFQTTGGTTHSTPINGLNPGSSYNYYIRCTDGTNANPNDFTISFNIFPNPDCTLTVPSTVNPNTAFNITWSSVGAIHAAYRYTGNTIVQLNNTPWPTESDVYYLTNLTVTAKILAASGTTTFNVCFDQANITGTYDQCLARSPNKVCSKTIAITGTPVALEGDVNNDSSVNIQDIQAIVGHFGKVSAYPANIDLASPGVIDLFDVMVVVKNWGRTA